jgi:hypothetical protein
MGTCRGDRRADHRGSGDDPPGLDLGDPAVARDRQHAVSCRRVDGGVEEQPFEQRLRDIHTVAQQSQGRQLHYESVGQILFGMEPENYF